MVKKNKNGLYLLWLMLFLVGSPVGITAQGTTGSLLPCFPGAEGFGATTPGGRGGRVIKVTNLDAGGPGSFQAACSAEGPRIVVFDTSGVIEGQVRIDHGRITIAGQTAPGAGITIRGRLYSRADSLPLEDIVVRFIRVRPYRAGSDTGDAIQFNRVRRCVLDHCSCSWSTDEAMGLYEACETTVQWCAIEESDTVGHEEKKYHNAGFLNGPDGHRLSVHHNLFAHHRRRSPAIANGPADVRNNVVYNFRDGFLHDNPTNDTTFNIIGNYYKRGPNVFNIFPFCFVDSTYYYLRDNYIETVGLVQDPWAEAYKLDGLRAYADKGFKAEEPAGVPAVTTHSPLEACRLVLERAGCLPRDTVSRRTVEEVKNGTGYWGRNDPGDLMAGLTVRPARADSDGDGMPDEWEQASGLNPRDGSDHNTVMRSGYTAIEEYCNMLAEKLIFSSAGKKP